MEKLNHRHLPKATQAVKDSAGIYPGRLTPRTRAVNSRSPGTLEGRTDSELEEAVISWCSQVEDVEEVRVWGRVTFLNWVSEKRQIRRRVKSVGWKKFYLNRPLHYSAFIPCLQQCFSIALCRLSSLTCSRSSLQKDHRQEPDSAPLRVQGWAPSPLWNGVGEEQTAASSLSAQGSLLCACSAQVSVSLISFYFL